MKIAVESGKRSPFSFENNKIKVEGSQGLFHNGNISISKDNKIVYAGETRNQTNSVNQASSSVNSKQSSSINNNVTTSSDTIVKNKVSKESVLIDKSAVKLLSSGQKLGLNDTNIADNKLVIGVDLEFVSSEFDVDFSIFLLDENGKSSEENFIFYGNKISKDTSIKIDDDLGLNISRAFNSVISLDLNKVSPSIKRISLTGTLYDESNKFGNLKSGSISIVSTSKKEALSYKFTEKLSSENAIVICDLYLHNGNWKIQGIGQGFNGGLAALCGNFGVDTM